MMIQQLFRMLLAVVLFSCSSLAQESPGAASLALEQVLARMEEHGGALRSLSCDLSQKKWTHILEEFDPEERGRFYFLREGGRVHLRRDLEHPQESWLVISDGKLTFYQPRIKQALRRDLGQDGDRAEYLLLGFGSDPEALKESYEVQLVGQEKVGQRETHVLELSPRSPRVSAIFSKIVLWVDADLWVPVQQQLVEPTRDYQLIRFENIQLNPRLSRSLFEAKLPAETRVVGN